MIKIDNTYIHADTIELLNDLKSELAKRGINRFQIFRKNGNNIQTNCPFHKGGQEKKPSFGVNGEIDKCHCFSCGWAGSIEMMVSQLFGRDDKGKYGKKWIIRKYNSLEVQQRKIDLNLQRRPSKKEKEVVSEEELDKYRYYHDYMFKRGLTEYIIEQFDIGYDCKKDCITFPVYDLEGDCVFIARRSVKNKYFELPAEKNKPVYLANLFKSGIYMEAYITESFLNCLTLWKFGIPAMALIGTGSPYQYEILRKLPVRKYILALDPDEAGRKATRRFRENIKNKIIMEVDYNGLKEDINELQERFLDLSVIL